MAIDKLLRVTQVNAIYLDSEIEKSFQSIINEACKHLPASIVAPIAPELNLLLRFAVLKYSVIDSEATFGQQLLNIRYDNLTGFKKFLYLLFNSLDYVRIRHELWRPSHPFNKTISRAYVFLKILGFVNTSLFLRSGLKPRLIERILGLDQTYASHTPPRSFEAKYLARELLWGGFIEILLYVIPLINLHKARRHLKRFYPFHKSTSLGIMQHRAIALGSKCAHCGQDPILPHHMGCTHIFCYVCLKGNQTADPGFECPVCEHKNATVVCNRITL